MMEPMDPGRRFGVEPRETAKAISIYAGVAVKEANMPAFAEGKRHEDFMHGQALFLETWS